jgi:hypothetical protein
MPCPSHPPWLDHSNYAWRRVQVLCFPLATYNFIWGVVVLLLLSEIFFIFYPVLCSFFAFVGVAITGSASMSSGMFVEWRQI